MGDRTLKALRKYLNVRRAGEGVQEVFTTREGRRITYAGGQRAVPQRTAAAQMPTLSPV
jgi:site-specific recombinase XerC